MCVLLLSKCVSHRCSALPKWDFRSLLGLAPPTSPSSTLSLKAGLFHPHYSCRFDAKLRSTTFLVKRIVAEQYFVNRKAYLANDEGLLQQKRSCVMRAKVT